MNGFNIGAFAAVVLAIGGFFVFGSAADGDAAAPSDSATTHTDGAGSAAISKNVDQQSAASSVSMNAAAAPSNGTPRLHPVKEVCIRYEMTGQMMNGDTTRCHRKYAYEQYEIQNTTIGVAGLTQTQNQHTITIGDTIYAIDLQAGTGTKTANPMYAGLVSALDKSTPEQMAETFIASMGFTPNGQSKVVAGQDCAVHTAAQMGAVCLTDDGLMLEQNFMGNVQSAVSVSRGDGGADENYTLYETVPITEGPDLSNGLQGLIDQMGNQ